MNKVLAKVLVAATVAAVAALLRHYGNEWVKSIEEVDK